MFTNIISLKNHCVNELEMEEGEDFDRALLVERMNKEIQSFISKMSEHMQC